MCTTESLDLNPKPQIPNPKPQTLNTGTLTLSSVAWGVVSILKDFERSRHMGLRGRERCASQFNWDSIAEQTERIYYETM